MHERDNRAGQPKNKTYMNSIFPGKRHFIFLLTVLIFPAFSQANTSNLTLTIASELTALDPRKGYLLIDLETDSTAPSFTFKKLRSRQRYQVDKQSTSKSITSYKITVKNKANGLYLLSLPPGLYQITQVNVPFFNLPYKFDTDNRRHWRFYIEQGKINYIGKLAIAKTRSTSSVDVKLLNRLATDKERIDDQIARLLDTMPLVSGMGFRDDFLELLLLKD